MEKSRGTRDTSAATLARRVKKWRRWSSELREHGFVVTEPEQYREINREGE